MARRRTTRIGITLGDINGVGPEVAVATAAARPWPAHVRRLLIGDADTVALHCQAHSVAMPPAWTPGAALPPLAYWDPRLTPRRLRQRPGQRSVAAAKAAHAWIVAAAEAARDGLLDGIVTGPINKAGFMRAGFDIPGHTELLASVAAVRRVEMMLMSDTLRVVLATRHLPLRDVADTLTTAGLRATLRATAKGLAWLGVRRRRIAVCGLNPHAGDEGALGDEEQRLIRPALRMSLPPPAKLYGPVPADTVFYQAQQGMFDAIVAMYHDQGLAPFKMLHFDSGVNLTLGLPFVRTSPDHGTAYDLAGRGQANPASMHAALRWAVHLAQRPNPWGQRA